MPELKITHIKFFDYRGFYNGKDDEYFINIDQNNLLIYGENGSGKSSLFKGLQDFVYGNDFMTHNQTERESEGYIEIGFSDDSSDRLEESGTKPSKPEILNTSKLNSFLSYKELLKTYLVEETEEINLFELLIDGILSHHTLDSLGDLKTAWSNTKSISVTNEESIIKESLSKGEITEEESIELIERIPDEIEDKISNFNSELEQLISEINTELANILIYFKQDLEVALKLHAIASDNLDHAQIACDVKLFGQAIQSHHDFLNEARLSALAISIYLSALKLNPTSDTIKFIFMDDVFLGLDTGNRIPLINILNNEFRDWQIIITTYDRHWFNVAKTHLKGKWKQMEMYAGQKEKLKFEVPIIIQESNDYMARATKYFDAKDYPACSNYLRKEIENLIKRRLPEEFIRPFDGRPKALSYLWDLCIERYTALNIKVNPEVKRNFNLTRLILLNPMAHDSMHYPIYKKELIDAFELIEKIKAHPVVNQIVVLTKGTKLAFTHPAKNYKFDFELAQDWRLDIYDGIRSITYPKCKVLYWQFNNSSFWNFKTGAKLTKSQEGMAKERRDSMTKVMENLESTPGLSINRDMILENTIVEDLWTLKSYFDKIDETDKSVPELLTNIWTDIKAISKKLF